MLFNKRLLWEEINRFDFPLGEFYESSKKIIDLWQQALKDSDLDKTKEKTIQGKFLHKFFTEILGYTTQVDVSGEYYMIQHPKTEVDRDEPDGALGIFNKQDKQFRAVIELKDAKTPIDKKQKDRKNNLTPVEQAFNYLTKYDRCDWVIVSNFKEIRLYHKSRGQGYYEKFEILNLLEEKEYKRFYFLLCKDNLINPDRNSLVDNLVTNTSKTEEDISQEFYKKFKGVREYLFNHIAANNIEFDKKILIEKTQKLLDRLTFIMFCEDTADLLPKNTIKQAYERGMNSFSDSEERVWLEFKGLFRAIDEGNTRVKPPINAYNGGLFSQDEFLNKLIIKDEIWKEIVKLSEYDFDSDLNVNVLGHIFEQSLSDLEKFKAQLAGEQVDTRINKRKKEGIFYTPEYITRYIVEQTVGKYLEENPDKLETIKILDPACGSGAFLNQAHSFLREQYQVRWEEKISNVTQLKLGTHQNIAETNRNILLNNLYGVDLNEESVDITKLALWIKTAQKTEPLQNLDNNIKCGNSLIDDPKVAGDKAFVWQKEFAEICKEKKLQAYLITWVTYNSRVSERMIEFGVKIGEPVLFDEQSEIKITEFISDKLEELSLKVLAYNICKDHVHLIILSTDEERDEVIGQLKGYSSKKYSEYLNIDKGEKFHTWAQKYHYLLLDTEEKLVNAMDYVCNNRHKHDLSDNKGLKPLVDRALCSFDKAFEPQYYGGFDVVIGNPPYVYSRNEFFNDSEKSYFNSNYNLTSYQLNTYIIFVEKALQLLKNKAYFGFIIPNTWLTVDTMGKFRRFITRNTANLKIINIKDKVFEDANVDTSLLIFSKGISKNILLAEFSGGKETFKITVSPTDITEEENYVININKYKFQKIDDILKLISDQSTKLMEIATIKNGLKCYEVGKGNPTQTEDMKTNNIYYSKEKMGESYLRFLEGKMVCRYNINWNKGYLKYGDNLAAKRDFRIFKEPRILIRQIPSQPPYCFDACYTEELFLNEQSVNNIFDFKHIDPLLVLGIINSKLVTFWFIFTYDKLQRKIFPRMLKKEVEKIPIPHQKFRENSKDLVERVKKQLSLNYELDNNLHKTLNLINEEFKPKKISQKLKTFYTLGWNEFIEELTKQKVKLSLTQKEELMSWYKTKQNEIKDLQKQIDILDKEIDQEVYKLYNLTDKEIRIIEESLAQ